MNWAVDDRLQALYTSALMTIVCLAEMRWSVQGCATGKQVACYYAVDRRASVVGKKSLDEQKQPKF